MPSAPHSPKFAADGTVVSAIDWLGNSFSLGDTVLYAIGAGRGQMMAFGVVKQMRQGERMHYWKAGVEAPIEVQVLTTKTSGGYNNKQRTRPAWINAMNVTALPVTQADASSF